MVHAQGLDNVTTEMIAHDAGISTRTFFNYFPFKDAALVPKKIPFGDSAHKEFSASHGRLIDDIARLLDSVFGDFPYDRAFMLRMYEVATLNPRIMAMQQAVFQEFEDDLARLLSGRQEIPQEDHAELLASLVLSATRHGFKSWICTGTGTLTENIRASLAAMTGLLAGLARQPEDCNSGGLFAHG